MRKRFGKAALILTAILLAASAAVGGCGSGPGSGGSGTETAFSGVYTSSVDMASGETAAETMAATGEMYGYAAQAEAGYDGGAFNTAGTAVPAQEAGAGGGEETGAGEDSKDPRADRKLIRTVNLSVETTEFDTLLGKISQMLEAEGGYLEQSDVSGNSMSYSGASRRSASLTARIPSEKLDGFLDQVAEQSNVTYRSESVEDVTLQYTDVESRKKSLTIEQERLWELLEQADSVDSIIALEARLSEIRYQLEGFESQLRTYDNRVDYSTVYIDIREVGVFTSTEPDTVLTRIQKGFKRNLENVGTGVVDLFVWFVSSLPSIILLLFVLFLLWKAWKIFRRRRGPGKKEKSPGLPGGKGSGKKRNAASDGKGEETRGTETEREQELKPKPNASGENTGAEKAEAEKAEAKETEAKETETAGPEAGK